MSEEITQLSDSDIVDLYRKRRLGESLPTGESLVAYQAIYQWAIEFDVTPGNVRAIPTTDLCRHFEQWATANGHKLWTYELSDQGTRNVFGGAMKKLGLRKGREQIQYVDSRPRKMNKAAANYFRAWLRDNPAPQEVPSATAIDGA